MNLYDSSFLCLDLGTTCVRGVAQRIRNGRIDGYAIYSAENQDTVYALKVVIDELEQKIGSRFDSAYVTGNFGDAHFSLTRHVAQWPSPHKITLSDVRTQISQISRPENMVPMHIIPVQYDVAGSRTISTPIGQIDTKLTSLFATISYNQDRLHEIQSILRHAHIQAIGFFDPHFIQSNILRPKDQRLMFIDLGAEFTTASIWTPRGPMWFTRIKHGGNDINSDIAQTLSINVNDADRIKRMVSNVIPDQMDRFTPADTAYAFSRADVNDIIIPHIVDIIAEIKNSGATAIEKYKPCKLVLTGGGAEISNITKFFENSFTIPVTNLRASETVIDLSKYIWALEQPHVTAHINRHKRWERRIQKITSLFKRRRKPKTTFIPIMPSTLCFDMQRPETYTLFASGGISMIHVDIMDGLYVNKIAGSIPEISYIRAHTRAHLHVHLMTESPDVVATDAIAAGADTVIVSTGTSGLRRALKIVHNAGKRVGVALNPTSNVTLIDEILSEVDEIMVMTVTPGAAGQEFNKKCVEKISELYEIRRARGLKFKISVDGGINAETAKLCWTAGADYLVSGSYLANSNDFPLAVQSLLPTTN